jgi:hypothetical protein
VALIALALLGPALLLVIPALLAKRAVRRKLDAER